MIYIYEIQNRINGKKYIGQTINYEKRMKEHIYGRNSKQNSVIDRSILKYGKENFDFRIIDDAENQINADEKERYYVEKYDTLKPNGYNVLIGGRSQQGSWNQLKVYMYDLDGNYLNEFESASEIERLSNSFYLQECINACCRKGNGRYKDKMFRRYKKDKIHRYIKPDSPKIKSVNQFDMSGKLLSSFRSVTEASKITKTSRTSILGVLRGIYKSANGFLWSYSDKVEIRNQSIKRTEIYQLDENMNIIESFVSCAEAERKLNLRKGAYKTIFSVLDSNKKRYGYYWVRKDNHVPSLCE